MPPTFRPNPNIVVRLVGRTRSGQRRWKGTGFFCRVRHWFDSEREILLLVTNAHVIHGDFEDFEVIFPPAGGGEVEPFTVTAKIGLAADKWTVDRERDLAVLRLDGEHLPEPEIRRRSFDVDHDALAVWELRRRRIAPGDEAFLVGFVLPQEPACRQFPGLRLATISGLPQRVRPGRQFMLDGVVLGGNSGSPVVLRRDPAAGGGSGSGAAGKLLGIVCGLGSIASVIRVDENGVPVEARENAGRFEIVPVDVLRALVSGVVLMVGWTETLKPKLRRWWGWLRGRRQAD